MPIPLHLFLLPTPIPPYTIYPIPYTPPTAASEKGHLFAHSDGFFVTITDFGQYKH